MNISSGDALWHWSDGVTLGVGILKLVAIGGEVNTAVNAHEIKIEKSGRVVWGRCAQLAFEVINGIVVRGKDEKFGTLFVEADGAGGKVGDDS